MSELPKAYDPQATEAGIYQAELKSGFFNPDKLRVKPDAPAFSISLPPPNATGILHIGHAVMVALQDILIRFHRMKGDRTLWLPGTDHAAIATQNVVEQELKKEGKTKHDPGRERFLERVSGYVNQSQGVIRKQIERLGASCDWSRERFTLDEGLSRAVTQTFVTMYEDGLIYRGDRIVNWCPRCQSTLADDEVEYKEKQTPFYYFKYGPVIIGTARPETKFGDKVIVVHPDDERYKQLVGRELEVEWILGPIKARVIADPVVDPELGSGAMTITPGHSFEDFALAQKHGVAVEKIIDENARLTEAAGPMKGLSVKEARKKAVEILQAKGLVDHIDENYVHNLSVCYRCGTPVEPLVSKQWFVAVDKPTKRLNGRSLKQRALEVIEKNEIRFVPERFAKTYRQWMENLHDWCISRQIWYGHRIPVWSKDGEVRVDSKSPGSGWTQDSDTLDTWFSSSLWTFSTLGWPCFAKASHGAAVPCKDLKTFHPTSVMETGYDILFFWVARMIMMSTYLLDEIPFKTVYLHGLVRDEKGRKMSKSLGNGIDPLAMADKYGADAVRLSLVIGTTPGNDQKLSEQKIAGYRNYANKIWNIGRYLGLQSESGDGASADVKSLSDRWIASRLQRLIVSVTDSLDNKFAFSAAGEAVYDFAWHEFADWYLEIVKIEGNVSLARRVFGDLLKLLHPFMPFVTEELWCQLGYDKNGLLMIQPWPKADDSLVDTNAEAEFEKIKTVVTEYRQKRHEARTAKDAFPVSLPESDWQWAYQALIERLARVKFNRV